MHARSYKFLRWLAQRIDEDELPPPRVLSRHNQDVTASVLDWIEPNIASAPAEMQPDRGHLREFAAFFGTYVTTSFDLDLDPGKDLLNNEGPFCPCEICTYLGNGSHLKAKKVFQSDKLRAKELMLDRLRDLSAEEKLDHSQIDVEAVLSDPELRRAAANSTYGYWLIQRMKGYTDGTSILALWREFAWKPEGSPRKGLQFQDFVEAEKMLVGALQSNRTNAT